MLNVSLLAAALVAALALVSVGRAADDVVGAIWKIEFKEEKTPFRLQCTKDYKVFGPAGKEIGTWKAKGATQAEIKITAGGEKRNGTYVITQQDVKPPTFRGQYTSDKGDKINVKVTQLKD